MRIEIRNPTVTCDVCGAGEILYVPSHNAHLERDLRAHFEQPHPWYRPLRKRRAKLFAAEVERVTTELRDLTIRL